MNIRMSKRQVAEKELVLRFAPHITLNLSKKKKEKKKPCHPSLLILNAAVRLKTDNLIMTADTNSAPLITLIHSKSQHTATTVR